MSATTLLSNISSGDNTTFTSSDFGEFSVEKGFKCAAYAFVVIFALIGNAMIVAAFALNVNGKLRTVNNIFIVSMAIGDILLTLGSTPERITRILVNDEWIVQGGLGRFLCKTTNYIEKLCMNVSILHLAMIAIDRFLVVFYPRKKIITAKRSRQIVFAAWLASAAYCVPLFYYANLFEDNERVFCKTRRFFPYWRVWYMFFLAVLVLTLILVVALYTAIAIRLWRTKTPGVRISFRSRLSARMSSRVLKMVAMIVFTFYLCFLPYWIGWVFCSYHRNDVICSRTYVFVSIFLSYANSAVNPVIYSFFNDNFRVGFKFIFSKLCKCCFSKRKLYIQRGNQLKLCDSYVVATGIDNMKKSNCEVRCNNVKKIESKKASSVQV